MPYIQIEELKPTIEQKEKLDKIKILTKKQKKKVYKDNFELLFELK